MKPLSRRAARRTGAWAALAAFLLAAPGEARIVRLGIMVGHNVGYREDQGLKFAEADAQKMAQLFTDVGGMRDEDFVLLRSPKPEDLDRAFDAVTKRAAEASPQDEVIFLFYYSGHGTREFLKLGRDPYPLAQLKARIEKVPCKLRIGILDACQSGAITRIKGARVVQPFLVEQDLKSAGSILIASSAEDENSQESDQLRGSFFTHHWHTALRGAGDASGDGRVSLLEAYQYAYNKTLIGTRGTRGGAQHPSAQFKLDTEGDVILTDLNNGMGGLRFAEPMQGELLVANSRAEVMAEFRKETGKESFLALPPGRYRIYQRDGRRTRHLSMVLEGAEIRTLGEKDLVTEALLASISKGGVPDDGDAVKLPWEVKDWSSQAPVEIGIGFFSENYPGLTARVGWKFKDPFAVIFSGSVQQMDRNSSMWDLSMFYNSYRLGLQKSQFLSPNLEFLGTLYHRSAYSARFVSGGEKCTDDICFPGKEFREEFQWIAGTGFHAGIRFWLLNRFSLQLQYGTEYVYEDGRFSADPLTFLPSVHF